MRSLRILPVGNGACSVIRESRLTDTHCFGDAISIIDCGRGSRGGRKAASFLQAELSPGDWNSLQSLVVTHWDADHWNGLRYIADSWPRPATAKKQKLLFYSPAIPFDLPPRLSAGVSALISATSVSGIEAIDFAGAWGDHFDLIRSPVAQGDTIELAGRSHRVEWPPRTLGGTAAEKARSVLAQIETIARANPRFGKLLEDAYSRLDESPFGISDPRAHDELAGLHELIEDASVNRAEDSRMPSRADQEDDGDADDLSVEDTTDGKPSIRQDEAWEPVLDRQDHRVLIRDARKLQNELSLVFHDSELRSLIVYGDAPEKVIEALAPSLHTSYGVQLAPHHGTHAMPANAPHSRICVAQCSQTQRASWQLHTRNTDVDLAICDYELRGLQLPLLPWWWRVDQ
jgi:hypothetical protein